MDFPEELLPGVLLAVILSVVFWVRRGRLVASLLLLVSVICICCALQLHYFTHGAIAHVGFLAPIAIMLSAAIALWLAYDSRPTLGFLVTILVIVAVVAVPEQALFAVRWPIRHAAAKGAAAYVDSYNEQNGELPEDLSGYEGGARLQAMGMTYRALADDYYISYGVGERGSAEHFYYGRLGWVFTDD